MILLIKNQNYLKLIFKYDKLIFKEILPKTFLLIVKINKINKSLKI